MLKVEIERARRGIRGARQVLGGWWRCHLLHPPQALAEYVAEAFDRGDLNVALGLSREEGMRGLVSQDEERLRGARAAIVRYLLLEHAGNEKLAYEKGRQILNYAAADNLKRSCGHRVAELLVDESNIDPKDLEYFVDAGALDGKRDLQ